MDKRVVLGEKKPEKPADAANETSKAGPNEWPNVDRRRKRDLLSKAVPVVSLLGWIFIFVTYLLLDRAAPESANFFSSYYNKPVRSFWNSTMIRFAFAVLILVFALCVMGILFNLKRNRRKGDKLNISLIILAGLTLIGIVWFLIQFGNFIF